MLPLAALCNRTSPLPPATLLPCEPPKQPTPTVGTSAPSSSPIKSAVMPAAPATTRASHTMPAIPAAFTATPSTTPCGLTLWHSVKQLHRSSIMYISTCSTRHNVPQLQTTDKVGGLKVDNSSLSKCISSHLHAKLNHRPYSSLQVLHLFMQSNIHRCKCCLAL